jgi:hypothetical protein
MERWGPTHSQRFLFCTYADVLKDEDRDAAEQAAA